MVMHTNDPTYGASDREIAWAYGKIKQLTFIESETADQMRANLKEHARSDDGLREVANNILQSQSQIIDIGNFDWLQVSNLKLMEWLKINRFIEEQKQRDKLTNIGIPPHIPLASTLPAEEYFRAYIFSIDIWVADNILKRNYLSNLESRWNTQQKQDQNLKWINENNEKQVDWAWEYLEKRPQNDSRFPLYIPHLQATNQREKSASIYVWFYIWGAHPADIREFQRKMKRAWAQKKYRSGLEHQDKKQSTYALNNQTKRQLKVLAKVNNVNLHQMLEHIIDEAYKNRKKRKTQPLPI